MKKILLFLLLPLFSFSQSDRGCRWYTSTTFACRINNDSTGKSLYTYNADPPILDYSIDTSAISLNENDSLTFYYVYSVHGAEFAGGGWSYDTLVWPSAGEGLILLSGSGNASNTGYCESQSITEIFRTIPGTNKIVLNYSNGNPFISCKINWIEDSGDRNINIKLNSSSSLNIATKKGNQTLRMVSMNGQLVYSYSFDAAEFAGVNISLPENIFPSGIYILSLVSATEAQNFKVFVH